MSIVFTREADQKHDHASETALARAIDKARYSLFGHLKEFELQKTSGHRTSA